MPKLDLEVESIYAPERIDAYLAKKLIDRYSRSQIKRMIDQGLIQLNGQTAKPRSLVNPGDKIAAFLKAPEESTLIPEEIPITVLYEDDSIIVVDKAAGMVVHPGAGNKKGTLVQALLGRNFKLSTVGGALRPGIVHRLDKDVSGALVVAKDNFSHRQLQSQFEDRSLTKIYTALVKGRMEYEEGRVLLPIGRDVKIRQKMAVSESASAKSAETYYRVLKRYAGATLLEIRIATGRTHQIRVHLAHLGHPVIGDPLYGRAENSGPRIGLHATKLEFLHPKSGKVMKFESPFPPDFLAMIRGEEEKSRPVR